MHLLELRSVSHSLIQHRMYVKLASESVREDTDCVIKPSWGVFIRQMQSIRIAWLC